MLILRTYLIESLTRISPIIEILVTPVIIVSVRIILYSAIVFVYCAIAWESEISDFTNSFWNCNLAKCSALKTTYSDVLKSFLENHICEVFALVESIWLNSSHASRDSYFSDSSAIETSVFNYFEPLLENNKIKIWTFAECIFSNARYAFRYLYLYID